MDAERNWELSRDAAYFGKIDRLDRECEFIDKRAEELTQPGAYFDPFDPKIIEDALGDLPDLTHLAATLRDGDREAVYQELARICREYASDAARAMAQRELGYDK